MSLRRISTAKAFAIIVLYDALRVKRQIEAVLSTTGDKVLAAATAMTIALIIYGIPASPGELDLPFALLAVGSGVLGMALGRSHKSRWNRLAHGSIVAPAALTPGAEAPHLAAVSCLMFAVALPVAAIAGVDAVTSPPMAIGLAASWLLGTMAGQWLPPLPLRTTGDATADRRLRTHGTMNALSDMSSIVVRWQFPLASSGKHAFLFAAAMGSIQAFTAGSVHVALESSAGPFLVAGAALATLLAMARVPAPTCRFSLSVGVGAFELVKAHLLLLSFVVLGSLVGAGIFAGRAPLLLGIEFACGALVAIIVIFRSMHYRLMPEHSANRSMRFQLVPLALCGALFPPAVPALVLMRLVSLYRGGEQAKWDIA